MSDRMIDIWTVQDKLNNMIEPIVVAGENLNDLKADELIKHMNNIDDASRLLIVLLDQSMNYPVQMKIGMEALLIQLDSFYSAFNNKYFKETN